MILSSGICVSFVLTQWSTSLIESELKHQALMFGNGRGHVNTVGIGNMVITIKSISVQKKGNTKC